MRERIDRERRSRAVALAAAGLCILPDPRKTQRTRFPPVLGRRTPRAVHRLHRLCCNSFSRKKTGDKEVHKSGQITCYKNRPFSLAIDMIN